MTETCTYEVPGGRRSCLRDAVIEVDGQSVCGEHSLRRLVEQLRAKTTHRRFADELDELAADWHPAFCRTDVWTRCPERDAAVSGSTSSPASAPC